MKIKNIYLKESQGAKNFKLLRKNLLPYYSHITISILWFLEISSVADVFYHCLKFETLSLRKSYLQLKVLFLEFTDTL